MGSGLGPGISQRAITVHHRASPAASGCRLGGGGDLRFGEAEEGGDDVAVEAGKVC